jgi:hypothetical protein
LIFLSGTFFATLKQIVNSLLFLFLAIECIVGVSNSKLEVVKWSQSICDYIIF